MNPLDQIDTAGTIVHEATHRGWYQLGGIYDSKDQEGAAFAMGDMVKRELCLDVGYIDNAQGYRMPFMSVEERRRYLSTSEVYSGMPDGQIWWPNQGSNDIVRTAYGVASWVINQGFLSLIDVVSSHP